ncbi:efflux RND transporter periplasmic adaptor subunit [Gloeobacter violaceus]|uniref:Gll0346 protein n=1 Tax=Gloeobacter violaceus (strain ATCC 29082 / PCC 7421) TaxID=251221 RepID=Q7NNR4_GLOVI|nr:efflux RND transporter periplasmic adaptor subunit [Gloeobacter violaceus]BAC88287.1 gll0346 [Gloeobacter violaceus PCC 7421]
MLLKWKRPLPWLIGLAIFGTGAAAVIYVLGAQSGLSQAQVAAMTIPVATTNLGQQVQASGLVQPIRKTNLSPRQAGRIGRLLVDEGRQVKQGELVAQMESRLPEAQVRQAEASLARAQAELLQKRRGARPEEIREAQARLLSAEAAVRQGAARLERTGEELARYRRLAGEGATSQNALSDYVNREREAAANLAGQRSQLEAQAQVLARLRKGTRIEEIRQAEAGVALAQAQLDYFRTQLEETRVYAPFAGVISRRFAQQGDYVTPSTAASTSDGASSTSIVELVSGLEVEAKVPEASLAQIYPGQAVQIRTDAYPGAVFKGRVRLVTPRAVREENVTTIRVKVTLLSGQGQLRPGLNVKVNFTAATLAGVSTIPLAAVISKQDGQTGVLVPTAGNRAQFRPVRLGTSAGSKVQILEGLRPGERVFLQPPPEVVVEGVDTLVW